MFNPLDLELNKEVIVQALADCGYQTHPKGIAQPYMLDFTVVSDSEVFLDINADAVRKNGEVPDRRFV